MTQSKNYKGIVREVDRLGRIVIPKEFRRTFNINEGDSLEILAFDDELTLRKYDPIERNEKVITALNLQKILGDLSESNQRVVVEQAIMLLQKG